MTDLKELLRRVYAATDDGLDIITSCCPAAARAAATNVKKLFRYRDGDRTPSAHLYRGDDCWRIIDFGLTGEGHSLTPIDVYMAWRGYGQRDFSVAVLELAEQYGVADRLAATPHRPVTEQRAARADEPDGLSFVVRTTPFTAAEVRLWGRHVTAAMLTSLGWSPVATVTAVKASAAGGGRTATVRHATEAYPIFVQACPYVDDGGRPCAFYKLYEPCCANKRYRFSVVGTKPRHYLYGLDALRQAVQERGGELLEAVLLVSGGSDAVAALSMGWQPVWCNSETDDLLPADYALLLRYARRVVSVPDLDATGVRCGRRRALQQLTLHTLWLPGSRFTHLHDSRGHARKDLKDYVDAYPSAADFALLVRGARAACFWHTATDRAGREHTTVSLTALAYFCGLNGWYRADPAQGGAGRYLHVDGHLVEEVPFSAVRDFLRHWLDTQPLTDAARDAILRSTDVNKHLPDCLDILTPDVTTATEHSQCFHFRNGWVEVTPTAITLRSYDELPAGRYVWRSSILPHDYRPSEPLFSVEGSEADGWHVSLPAAAARSPLLTFLVGTSRLYWRQELEQPFGDDRAAAAAYAAAHRCCLDGDGLTPAQQAEQMRCMANKLFACGYLLHAHKVESRAYACIALDHRVSDVGECNGRTGKSLFGKVLARLTDSVCLDANRQEKADSRFFLSAVTPATRLIFIDECHRLMDIHDFFPHITDDLTVERKGIDPFTIPFARSPKLLLATNHALRADDASTWARLLPVVFGDYYHELTPSGDYRESRSVEDDLGCRLMTDGYEHWADDIAFLMQCVQFYLRVSPTVRKLMPPMANVSLRQQKAAIGTRFEQWADDYFAPDSGHLDVRLTFDDVFNSYERDTRDGRITRQHLVQKIKDYCRLHGYVYNPADITGLPADGERWRQYTDGRRVAYLYLRSLPAPAPASGSTPVQTALDLS